MVEFVHYNSDRWKQLLNNGVQIIDRYQQQLTEYYETVYVDKSEASNKIIAQLAESRNVPSDGNWVYYSWRNTLLHTLAEREFIETRTNRNLYRITAEQREQLGKKTVFVAGQSVGQIIAQCIAMERLCGHLIIADFDVVELSNLNRLKCSILDLGISKTELCRRAVLELDPYLQVTCYDKIIDDSSLSKIVAQSDAIIEEVDDVEFKVKIRLLAKLHKRPVITHASDRDMLDIERYDLTPERPIYHGLVSEPELRTLNRLEYIIKLLGGLENISEQARISLREYRVTTPSWSQLASAVHEGASSATTALRQIFTGISSHSGRIYIDIEERLKNSHNFIHSRY